MNVGVESGEVTRLAAGDVGARMQVVVTASNSAGSAAATSAQTVAVAAQASSGTLTVNLASGADDGEVDVNGSQGVATRWGAPLWGCLERADGDRGPPPRLRRLRIYVPLLRFDTSGLPAGATVTSATLKVFVNGSVSADNRKLVG